MFFLVVDELHMYRGTPGTEVAYILRLLLERIGLSPASDQLRILRRQPASTRAPSRGVASRNSSDEVIVSNWSVARK